MTDCVGNEVHEGAILKVSHFRGARGRKHFMYKQVGPMCGEYREIWHLPITPLKSEGFYLIRETDVLKDSVVVACDCKFHLYNDLKLSKRHGA